MRSTVSLPSRSESHFQQKQAQGQLQVRTAADYRRLVEEAGLAEAYARTDVVVAADAGFTDQASLHLSLGATDPPIRLRDAQLAGVNASTGHGSSDLVLPIGGGLGGAKSLGGAQVLAALLKGDNVPLAAVGEATALHPRPELHTELNLERIAGGRLVLHRGIVENGVVAVSSAEGLNPSPYGPLLGPYATALYTCGGAGSIGLTMPALSLLGPGSPVLVGGAIGWVIGAGSGHQPQVKRQTSGQALSPGCCAAVSVDLHALQPRWVRSCFFEGHGSALMVAIAAAVPLVDATTAEQASTSHAHLQAPVLDLSIPRRLKPSLGMVRYSELQSGQLQLPGPIADKRLRCAPAHSPQLAHSLAAELVRQLDNGLFPVRLPLQPLSSRPSLVPLEA